MDGGAGYANVALKAAAMVAQGISTGMKIDETISDYQDQMDTTNLQMQQSEAERSRRVTQTRGVMNANLGEASQELSYQAGAAAEKAALANSAAKAAIGYSGLRMAGSPLAAIRQTERINNAAAAETIRSGGAQLKAAGTQYANQIADINAQASALTAGYQRQYDLMKKKRDYLQQNKVGMIALASAGAAVDVGEAVINSGEKYWGWGPKEE